MPRISKEGPAARPVKVLLVDDHEIVLAGLTLFLRRAAGIHVVGEARSMAAAIEAAAELSPDVILMDLRLPDGSGIDACREILSDHPGIRVLFLSSYPDEDAVMATVVAGASGYLIKDIAHPALQQAILDVAAGKTIVDPSIAGRLGRELHLVADLSPQERRVLALVVEGKTNKEIGEALELSVKTVKNYLTNAFQKLNVSRRSQIASLLLKSRVDKPGLE